jgi:hypothetical protein
MDKAGMVFVLFLWVCVFSLCLFTAVWNILH